MSREHYDACFRYGIKSSPDEKCNCYEFDKALEWASPYLLSTIRERVEGMRTADAPECAGAPCQCHVGVYLSRSEVLSLLTEIEGEMK